eukprot:TRINITY_DN18010_c0_g1_i2.p1 TRINITY_DN18010_c0_g1~~TRINITY_DN18010_c0_g1_i2.p1  ORF type:complete len:1065 (-),score=205.05 TRINITY_DN18010_c0_g1_i2:23-3217(-)
MPLRGQPLVLPKLGSRGEDGRLWSAASGSRSARAELKSAGTVSSQLSEVQPPRSARVGYESMSSSWRSAWRQGSAPRDPWDAPDDGLKFGVSTSTAMSWSPSLQATLQELEGPPASLQVGDLHRSSRLKEQLQQLRLSEFFDTHGGPHFHRLGISFAAKQDQQVGSTFGSTNNLHAIRGGTAELIQAPLRSSKGMVFSARSYLAAAEAKANDLKVSQRKAQTLMSKVNAAEKLKNADVGDRRSILLFREIPHFKELLPPSLDLEDLIPTDVGQEQEIHNASTMERQNGYLNDHSWLEGSKMNWLLAKPEVQQLMASLEKSCISTRGFMSLGMDRPTFCLVLLELELVDQVKVPYFWAVKLFDSLAKPTRLCPPNSGPQQTSTAPVQDAVNHFCLLSVLDAIIRQRFDRVTRDKFLTMVAKANFDNPQTHQDSGRPSQVDDSVNNETLTSIPDSSSPDANQTAEDEIITREEIARRKVEEEKKAWKEVAERERACRERLVCSMLLEPEVLHLTCMYQELFAVLFSCYSVNGGMEYPHLLHFCIDFQLIPQCITQDSLQLAYASAKCFEILEPLEAEVEPLLSPAPSEPPTPASSITSAGSKRAGSHKRSATSGHASKRASTSVAASKRASTVTAAASKRASMNAVASRRTSAMAVASKRTSTLTPASMDSTSNTERSVEFQTTGTEETLPLVPTPSPCPTRFGVAAFMETVCKVAFSHLAFHGNALQRSSSSYYKISWLIAHLRHMLVHMHQSQKQRADAGQDLVQGPVASVLKKLPPSWWDDVPPLKTTLKVRGTVLQPVPGQGNKKVPTRRARQQQFVPKLQPGFKNTIKAQSSWNVKRRRSVEQAKAQGQLQMQALKSRLSIMAVSHGTPVPVAAASSSEDEDEDDRNQGTAKPQGGKEPPGKSVSEISEEEPQGTGMLHLPLEDLFPIEAGFPAIVDGECQLCGRQVHKAFRRDISDISDSSTLSDGGLDSDGEFKDPGMGTRGNPSCRGCSLVDCIKFKDHPFARLLLRREPAKKTLPLEAKPITGMRISPAFPPPPKQSFTGLNSDIFLSDGEGDSFLP